jgi:hypothetical protein
MALCVYVRAIMGIVKVRQGDFEAHRVWMFGYAGSMWGAFWLFRVMEFALGPLLRNYNTVSILICIWFSAPLGFWIAELIHKRVIRESVAPSRGGVAKQLNA